MSRPTHATPGGHAYLELQRRARAEGLGTQELLIWYVHERFLYRLSRSNYRDRLILKGGMLLAAFEARRATQDIDLLGRQIANDVSAIAAMITAIARIDVADGVEFAADRITTGAIRDETAYGGVRVTMPAMVDRAKVTLRIDVSVGDPVTPAPIDVDYPSLLDRSFVLRGYPIATVIAEKAVTLMERGETNTRERDVADIVVLAADIGRTTMNSPRRSRPPRRTATRRSNRFVMPSESSARFASDHGRPSSSAPDSWAACPRTTPTHSTRWPRSSIPCSRHDGGGTAWLVRDLSAVCPRSRRN